MKKIDFGCVSFVQSTPVLFPVHKNAENKKKNCELSFDCLTLLRVVSRCGWCAEWPQMLGWISSLRAPHHISVSISSGKGFSLHQHSCLTQQTVICPAGMLSNTHYIFLLLSPTCLCPKCIVSHRARMDDCYIFSACHQKKLFDSQLQY